MKVVVIQGPNLNMLGMREQNIYGPTKLEDIHAQMEDVAKQKMDKKAFKEQSQ
jgi:3-dehydroquinate dehydratase-2